MMRCLLLLMVCACPAVAGDDWPSWRGPLGNGVADAKQKPPTLWNESENVLWKAELPGRGHGSATVVGDRVYLAVADAATETQSLFAFHRETGKKVWQADLHKGGFEKKGNAKGSLASSSPACDGERIYINFQNANGIHTSAVGLDGAIIWQKKVVDYVLHQGFGSSPMLHRSLVIVAADNKGGGAIVGLDRVSGSVVWSHARPKLPNYVSPVILTAAGKEQLILTGCDLVTSLDPMTGKVNWETKGATTECVTSTVTDGKHIFTTGGYPKNHIAAMAADGSGKVVWENLTRVYVPSLIVRNDHIYGVIDDGFAVCWRCDTGKEVWRERLGGAFTASPVLVGDTIYATNESGVTFLFEASPKGYAFVAKNKLGDETFASPTICGSRVYLRVAKKANGQRQETLYCLGTR